MEYDSNLQLEVAKSPAMISKLLFMIDRSQSETAEYSLFSSQVASNTLFYCTFNVKSAQYLVNYGVVEKMLNITKKLLDDEEGDFPLRLENFVKLFLFIFSNRFFLTILTDNSVCTSLYILSTSSSSVILICILFFSSALFAGEEQGLGGISSMQIFQDCKNSGLQKSASGNNKQIFPISSPSNNINMSLLIPL